MNVKYTIQNSTAGEGVDNIDWCWGLVLVRKHFEGKDLVFLNGIFDSV